MKSALLLVFAMLSATVAAGTVQAQAVPVETCMEDTDVTLVTWDCEFEDSLYTEGDVVEMTVTWSVDAGPAAFYGFEARGNKFTPRSKHDPVEGTEPTIIDLVDGANGSVTVSFVYLNLHAAGKKGKKKGNAHFFLLLKLDEDGDGVVDEKETKFGVNLHVTQPEADPASGLFRLAGEEPVEAVTWGALKSRFNR